MIRETGVQLADGRKLHVYDTGEQDGTRLTVFWHHGTPNTGVPPEPLFPAADRLGIRWVSHDRPGPRSHAEWLAGRCPSAQLRLYPEDGHISVLDSATTALDWLAEQADQASAR